jgi:uncharacterized repeat protein (TIGR03847 family)
MPRRLFLFDEPERFIAGTIGEPGDRTFYLQARDGSRIVSVSLEKVQVAVLAERLGTLLDDLRDRGIETGQVDGPATDVRPLDEPLNEAFRAAVLSLGWDGDDDRIVIEAREATEEEAADAEVDVDLDDDDPDGPDLVRVRLSAERAREFVGRALRTVAAGRPPCPFCGQPLDPQGHLCPRRNGTYVH